MKMNKNYAVVGLAVFALALAGCDGSEEAPVLGSSDAGDFSDTAVSGGDDTSNNTGDDVENTGQPEEDFFADCPEGFQESRLTTGTHNGFDVDGEARSFELWIPQGDAPAGGFPLFIAYHGTGETGASFANRAQIADFVDAGMVVAAPNGAGHGTIWPIWDAMRIPGDTSPNPDLAYFDHLVACLTQNLALDDDAIFAGGHSAGGIMTNALLRQRSHILAGGIVASGIFELTGESIGQMPQDPALAIVTWGGDNDTYQGATPDGTVVQEVHFSEQAVLASQAFDATSSIDQIHCKGDELGHVWLSPLNDWKASALLAAAQGDTIPEPPTMAGVATCSKSAAATLPPLHDAPTCESTAEPLCATYCDQYAQCIVPNITVGPSLKNLTDGLGITPASCHDCVANCENILADDAGQESVLQCLTAADRTCSGGLKSTLPLFNDINTCCFSSPNSPFCQDICAEVSPQDTSAPFLPICSM